MELALGHATHYQNLRAAAAVSSARIAPTWLPIPFQVRGPMRLVPLLRSNWGYRAPWLAQHALRTALRSGPQDVLFFNTQLTALLCTDLMRHIPSIVSLDATPINFDTVGRAYGHRPASNGVLDHQKYRLNRRVFQSAALLVPFSEWARRSLIDDYGVDPGRIRVVASGAAPTFFEVGQRRSSPSSLASSGPVQVLFVGGDFARKGGWHLLEALEPLLRVGACELHLVTSAPVPTRPHVHLYPGLGPNSPALVRLYAQADLFALPSLGDCLSVALMEATAAGLPVVTTTVGALGEAMVPDVSGLLVEPGDVAGLRQALGALIGDPARRERMGRASHTLGRAKFDAAQTCQRLFDGICETAASGAVADQRAQLARNARASVSNSSSRG